MTNYDKNYINIIILTLLLKILKIFIAHVTLYWVKLKKELNLTTEIFCFYSKIRTIHHFQCKSREKLRNSKRIQKKRRERESGSRNRVRSIKLKRE